MYQGEFMESAAQTAKFWKVMGIGKISISIPFAMAAGLACANPCAEKIDIQKWAEKYKEGLRARNQTLSEIRTCIATAPQSYIAFDTLAILSIKASTSLTEASVEQREGFLRFNADLLWVLAEAGFPNSQHNLAAMHNARPGSLEQGAIRQDSKIFMYWTRHAAAQGEPRAMFNLAARLARGTPELGIAHDPVTAYKLFTQVEKISSTTGDILGLASPVQQEKQKLLTALGNEKVLLLDRESMDLTALKPKGPLEGSTWDHEANVRDTVMRFYKIRMAQGEEAAWKWQQKCYENILGLRHDSIEHEACVAFDVASTQLAVALSQRAEKVTQKPIASRYEKNVFISRVANAFMQTGMTSGRAVERVLEVNALVAKATAEVSDIAGKEKK
jgi:hypothetical protein